MKRLWSNQACSKRFASNPDDPATWVAFREKIVGVYLKHAILPNARLAIARELHFVSGTAANRFIN